MKIGEIQKERVCSLRGAVGGGQNPNVTSVSCGRENRSMRISRRERRAEVKSISRQFVNCGGSQRGEISKSYLDHHDQ